MRAFLVVWFFTGIFAAALASASYMGGSNADFEQTVDVEPAEAYAAFSAIAAEGVTNLPSEPRTGMSIAIRVAKEPGRSIAVETLVGGQRVMRILLYFQKSGVGTLVSGDVVGDASVARDLDPDGTLGLSVASDDSVRERFEDWMEESVADLEAGRPLQPMGRIKVTAAPKPPADSLPAYDVASEYGSSPEY
jgi:hypothetical protein